MKYRVLIHIDQLFRPLYILAKALKWNKEFNYEDPHFVVLKFFGIGSITRIVHVMTTLNIAKDQVTFITQHKNKPIVELLNLNAVYIKTNHPLVLISSLFKLIIQIWKLKKTVIVDMERASNISGLFRLLIGLRKPCHSFYFKSKNKKKSGQLFISLKNKSATNAIAEMFNSTYSLPKERQLTLQKTNKIFININAGDYLPERKFTLSKYASLVKTLFDKNPDWHFYLTGVTSEYQYVESFKDLLKNQGIPLSNIFNIAGQHNLLEFTTFLKEAKLFITNDSGPLHLAYLFGVKTVGIWGPTSSKLVGYEDSNRMLNFNTEMQCAPCFRHPKSQVAKFCNGNITCFKSMDIKEMASKINSFVEQEKRLIA